MKFRYIDGSDEFTLMEFPASPQHIPRVGDTISFDGDNLYTVSSYWYDYYDNVINCYVDVEDW